MRKIKYLITSLLFVSVMANANPVSENTAAIVAGNYYKQTYNSDAGTLTLVYTEHSSDGQAVYYVFNVSSAHGFVIVSAEDAGYPIIGSSNTGQYVIPTTVNNVGFWMGRRKNEIISMRANNIQPTSDVSTTWNAYINNTPKNTHQAMSSVNPLLDSITWDQSPHYNAYCPGGSVTGCVATAMAQIMKYWKYPSVGLGSSCYYDEVLYGYTENYGELCATFDTSHYAWSEMPNKVTSANNEVAKLMYDCGVAVDMDYSPTSSGAFVVSGPACALQAYPKYFNYVSSTIKGYLQTSYSPTAWVNLIENELNHGRPVQYQGTDHTYGGHSWVCDGYNTSGYFHMNWGWSGDDDGYYSPTDLAPNGSGYDFSDTLVGAIIGIEPPGGLGIAQISTNQTITVYPNPGSGVYNIALENVTGSPQLTVYNVLGQQVYNTRITTSQTTINISSQPKGIYLYRIQNENGESISTGRLVIQ